MEAGVRGATSILHQRSKERSLCAATLSTRHVAPVATKESKRIMSRLKVRFSLIGLILLPLASAQAQDFVDRGFYAVGRAGGMSNPEVKFDTDELTAPVNGDDTVKYKFAPFGEIGGGYSFGAFRLEETLGYSTSDAKTADTGHARFFNLTISGFTDIPVSEAIVPYVGGGMGAARVDSTLSWNDANSGDRFDSRAWGPFWHLDAGVGFHLARRVTLEVGGRYARSFSMRKLGHDIGNDFAPLTGYQAVIGTVGIRYAF
jgi:opacity protein-like surface antigen